ncbi:MAG: hypothetical protein JW751_24375 [Polyangiaceae bacterium]|nr:hypothetical protein [Polyangiaceae bacterium]
MWIDEIALFDASGTGEERPQDTWLFMGDSIVDMSFDAPSSASSFPSLITAEHPAYTPLVINAGIGGNFSGDGLQDILDWLPLHPAITHFAIQYGTNDSWGNKRVATTSFEANMRGIVEAILAEGRVPVLARIPFANDGDHETLSEFNAVVDALTVEYGLPCGPDLYGWFEANPGDLSTDGVHPDTPGQRAINAQWAAVMTGLYVDG